MAGRGVIRTPWSHRWRRFCYSVMPFVSFVGCVVLVAWMWHWRGAQPNAVGEVEAVRVDVPVGVDGLLMPLPGGPWRLFDSVQSDQLLARLDDRPVQARLETVRGELACLEKEVDAAQVRLALDHAGRQRDHQQEAARLAWQAARCRLEMLDRKALIEAERVDLKRREMELEFLVPMEARASLSDLDVAERKLRRDEAAKRIEEHEGALAEAEAQWQAATEASGRYGPLEPAEVRPLLAPLEAAIAVQESRIRELELEIDSLEVRAPISGMVCAIHCWPGHRVRAGDPIVTLAADHGRYIISYVRQEQGFRPRRGMPVAVRMRLPGARPVDTVVERVGAQVELVPPRQRRNPAVPEWGQPVRIVSPRDLPLRPGESVDVTFQTWLAEDSG